jgi:hypothetical protein
MCMIACSGREHLMVHFYLIKEHLMMHANRHACRGRLRSTCMHMHAAGSTSVHASRYACSSKRTAAQAVMHACV